MKYIKVTGNVLWGQDKLTKEDLGNVLTRKYDTIIDTEEMKYFDADLNAWIKIPS